MATGILYPPECFPIPLKYLNPRSPKASILPAFLHIPHPYRFPILHSTHQPRAFTVCLDQPPLMLANNPTSYGMYSPTELVPKAKADRRVTQVQSTTAHIAEQTIDLASLAFCAEPLVPLSGDPWPTFDVVEAFTYESDPHLAPTIVTKNLTPVVDVPPTKPPTLSPQKSRRRAAPLDQRSSSATQRKSKSPVTLAKPMVKRIPRPRNAFMIYRSTVWAQQKITAGIERDHRHISRIIGHCWNSLPEEEKRIWRTKAEEEKQEHSRKYPNYRYSPVTRTDKPVKRNVNRNGEKDKQRCKKVAELLLSGTEGFALESAVRELDANDEGYSPNQIQNSPTSPTSSQSPITPLFSSKPLYNDAVLRSPKLSHSSQENLSHKIPTFSLSMLTPPEVSQKISKG